MCKKQIVDKFGDEKGLAKIQKLDGKPGRHRPDKDTKEDGEWHREYKVFSDEEEEANYENVDHELSSVKEIKGDDDKKEAEEDMASFRLLSTDANHSTASGSKDDIHETTKSESKVKIEGSEVNEDLKTFNKLKSNPKIILRSLQEHITEMKRMVEVAQTPNRLKYTAALTDEITKALPKLKSDYNSVEKIHLKSGSSTCIPDPEILAIARKIDKNYVTITDIMYWFGRLCPKVDKDRSSGSS